MVEVQITIKRVTAGNVITCCAYIQRNLLSRNLLSMLFGCEVSRSGASAIQCRKVLHSQVRFCCLEVYSKNGVITSPSSSSTRLFKIWKGGPVLWKRRRRKETLSFIWVKYLTNRFQQLHVSPIHLHTSRVFQEQGGLPEWYFTVFQLWPCFSQGIPLLSGLQFQVSWLWP